MHQLECAPLFFLSRLFIEEVVYHNLLDLYLIHDFQAETERKRKKCEEAKIRKEMVAKDLNDQMANSKGESEQAKYLRSIENRLDKAILKQQEAEHVKALYEKMRDQLQAKALTFHNTLEAREMEIEEANRELKRVKEMLVDAQVGFH